MITIFPDAKKHTITAHAVLKSTVLRADIMEKNGADALRINQSTLDFTISISDAPRYFYFEGIQSDTPFTVQIFSDGKPIDGAHFLSGSYNLPLAQQNHLIQGVPLMASLLVTGKPASPKNVSGISVNLSRMDIRRWAKEQRSGSEAGMDANMKEVLKSWGYIQ